jgi:hypothetical protein
MPYNADISRTNPTCFLFLLDQSNSMAKPFGGPTGKAKAEGLADAINRLIQNLALKCAKSEGIRDYFHVGVIGYGSSVGSALEGKLSKQFLVPISALADSPLRIEQRTRKIDDGAGGVIEQSFKFPVWFEAVAAGKTPMCEAFTLAERYLTAFLSQFPRCYPPLVINITDGQPTDGNPLQNAARVRNLASADGNVVLFNLHLSSAPSLPIEFPSTEDILPDVYSKLLFRMSSILPPGIQMAAQGEGYPLGAEPRGFVFNADLVSVIRFLDIGTRVARSAR